MVSFTKKYGRGARFCNFANAQTKSAHQSVLLKEVIECLSPRPNENFVDATIGAGGHALAILEKISPGGKVLGIDLNTEAVNRLKFEIRNDRGAGVSTKVGTAKFETRLILVQDNFANLSQIIKKYKFNPINGIIFDLGLSSDLLEKSGKGFSFQKDEFLDMRFGETGITAHEIINRSPVKELEKIFREYGEERFSDLITQAITTSRQEKEIETTEDLTNIISAIISNKVSKRFYVKIFARIFQALRIAVNNELENLKKVLYQGTEVLAGGGRIGVISFHSLEDRVVKNFFREKNKEKILKILTKKPITPTVEEIRNNPRARSAKLRVAEKL